jgi:hypothetical protein
MRYKNKQNTHLNGQLTTPMADILKTSLLRRNRPLPSQIEPKQAVTHILTLHEESNGATFSLYFGNQAGAKLYSVSIFPERSRILQGKQIPQEVLAAYIQANLDLLADPRCCIGTWYDQDTGRTYLDVSIVVTNKKLAISLSKRYNQEGAFDLHRGEYIPTGGTGEPPDNMPPLHERLSELMRRRKQE